MWIKEKNLNSLLIPILGKITLKFGSGQTPKIMQWMPTNISAWIEKKDCSPMTKKNLETWCTFYYYAAVWQGHTQQRRRFQQFPKLVFHMIVSSD